MATTTAPSPSRRRVATPESVAAAATAATTAEISRELINRVYPVSQHELAEVLAVDAEIATLQVRKAMLEAKVLAALQNGAPIQPGPLSAELAHRTVRASVSWKALVEENMGSAFANAKLTEAKEAVRGKRGDPYARVYREGV